MDVARTSMMHAAALHFLWPFAVRYVAHKINLHPRVSMPETSPALLWTGKVGDASTFGVWGSRAFVRDLSADKLSPRAAPCVFLGFPPNAPGWQFTTPPLAVLCPPRTSHPLPPQGPASSGVSQVDVVEPVEVIGDSGAAEGAEPGGADSGGAQRVGATPGGAEPAGATTGGAEPGGAASGGAEPGGAELGDATPSGPELGGTTPGGAEPGGRTSRAGGSSAAEGDGAAGSVGSRTGSTRAAGLAGMTGVGAPEGVGAEATAVGPRGGPAGGASGAAGGTGAGGAPGAGAAGWGYQPSFPLPAPSPYSGPTGGLAERREPASRPASPTRPARTSGHGSRQRPPPVPGTHRMSLRPSTAPLRAPLPSPFESSLPALADPKSYSLCAASPTDKQEEFQCLAASSPHLVSVLLTPEGHPDALDIPTPRSYVEAIEGPYSSQWQAAMDAEMASWKSTGTYVDAVPPPGANIVSGMWIFRVKRPPGSPLVFKARYWSLRRPVYGLRQAPREWHDTLRTTLAALGFAPSTADRSLFLRTDTSLPPFYILVYVDDLVFATADTAKLTHVKSELQKRHTCTDLGELRSYLGSQITRDRARRTITLSQSDMVQQVLQRFGFTYSSPQATPLPTRHSLSALPSDESVESSGPYPELVGCLMYLMTCTRPDLAYPLSILARYVAPGRHRPEHMAAAKRMLRYLCCTSGMGLVLGGQSPVVLTRHADAS
ncbi:unnamed protein product [Closterium sp. NIES-64]|nr:unnamed protein product [Closterium sp. NIES-64]